MLRRACACSERGAETIRHFLFDIAKMTGDWRMEDVLEEEMEKIRLQVLLLLPLLNHSAAVAKCTSWC